MEIAVDMAKKQEGLLVKVKDSLELGGLACGLYHCTSCHGPGIQGTYEALSSASTPLSDWRHRFAVIILDTQLRTIEFKLCIIRSRSVLVADY